MRTPKEYQKNISNGVITEDMLRDCLFSVNKRAKNCRDQERKFRHEYDYYNNEERYRRKKEEYYEQKDRLLKLLRPECIHREFYGYERERIYDDDPRYIEHLKAGDFVWQNHFFQPYDEEDEPDFQFDAYEGYYYETGYTVYFGDIELRDKPLYHYYLFYEMGKNSFHSPIDEEQLQDWDLRVVDIRKLETHGHETGSLVSPQFVRKVLALIETKEYRYVA